MYNYKLQGGDRKKNYMTQQQQRHKGSRYHGSTLIKGLIYNTFYKPIHPLTS